MYKARSPILKAMVASTLGMACIAMAAAEAPRAWVQGQHFLVLENAVATGLPRGKVEVAEVFSYGCPACNRFAPSMRRLVKGLPKNAVVSYVPASWIKTEDWPMFQQAYLTAKALGIATRAHDAMYDAIWTPGGKLAIADPATGRIKARLPTIEDAAGFYAGVTGTPASQFISMANSFGVALEMQRADERIKALQVDSTPTIVVNGKYLANPSMAGSDDELVTLVQWLVARETNSPAAKKR
jgi:protein dithiol oxidoreductase (disulfide-forming)